MSVPRKYRKLGDFHAYYSGAKKAPILTIVIGGNHEASNYLFELYYGGWLAPNIYYMGAANVIRYGPFRIAGLSGIFKKSDYNQPHYERLPYSASDIRSIYHVRDYDVMKLLKIRQPVDMGVSHDWPRRIEWFGDYRKLFRERGHFWESAKIDNLGSPPAEQLLNYLRPAYWFSGHMHIKYSATVKHASNNNITIDDIFKNLSISENLQLQLPNSMFQAAAGAKTQGPTRVSPHIRNDETKFLALDKPGHGREFLEIVEVNSCLATENDDTEQYFTKSPEGKFTLYYDEEWLAITRSTADALIIQGHPAPPVQQTVDERTMVDNLRWVKENITAKGLLKIPENFSRHAPVYDPIYQEKLDEQPLEFPNSQTDSFCRMIEIPNKFSIGGDLGK
ncbi:hypothetical protein EMPG_13084 [Blastomyces silverae]|uniref:Lariat debranching enzyme C-terminal domain-containing protein n=1 Tax=Blastomyces silverae TaxID=2060906 RepID=A0A0H1BRG8_9EURO|nr:hypothetical protein EMPG_13084 [Blastomyces silverae]